MGVTNTEILKELHGLKEVVHGIDTKMAVHISECLTVEKNVSRNTTALNGNGKTGIKQQIKTLWDKHLNNMEDHNEASSDRRKYEFDLKSAVVVLILTGVSQVVVHMVTQ